MSQKHDELQPNLVFLIVVLLLIAVLASCSKDTKPKCWECDLVDKKVTVCQSENPEFIYDPIRTRIGYKNCKEVQP